MFDATLAVVEIAVRDANHQIGPLEIHALLAEADDVPTLIGMRGVLTALVVHAEIDKNLAYLESTS